MPLVVNATPGDPAANAYLTVAAVTVLDEETLPISTWAVQPPDTQARAVVSATRILDRLDWAGAPNDAAQALAWPRAGTRDAEGVLHPSTTIPDEVQRATARLAVWLADQTEDVEASADTDGLRSMTLGGGIGFEFQDGAPRTPRDAFLRASVLPLLRGLFWASQPRVVRG